MKLLLPSKLKIKPHFRLYSQHQNVVCLKDVKPKKVDISENFDLRGNNRATLQFDSDSCFHFQLGGQIPELEITWKEYGNKSGPVVYVIPAFSANSHVCPHPDDESPGWWQDIVGTEKAIDLNHFRVICANILGSPYGTSSPISINPETCDRYAKTFPQITPRDQAMVHRLLLDCLGLERIEAIVGSSLGGMQALHLATIAPNLANKLIVISTTSKTAPATVAIRYAQRQAILMDKEYHNGEYHKHHTFPIHGIKVARTIGLISYLSRQSYNSKFDWHSSHETHHYSENSFEVESWLSYNSEKFTKFYDANCYLLMSKCMDLMDINWSSKDRREHTHSGNAFEQINAETLVIGIKEDTLTPIEEQKHIFTALKEQGKNVQLHVFSSPHGHDAFLKESAFFGAKIRQFLSAQTLNEYWL